MQKDFVILHIPVATFNAAVFWQLQYVYNLPLKKYENWENSTISSFSADIRTGDLRA
jgi:hypothetical protein